jgi:predicted transcriptional regulator of viral defense system
MIRNTASQAASGAEARVLERVRQAGILRPRDLDEEGLPREYLKRLHERGLLIRLGRGLYAAADRDLGQHETLVAACKAVPHGGVCLLSALRFHELTTQAPFEVWIAIDRKARAPEAGGVPLRVVRFSGPALAEGVEEHLVEGVPVRVYAAAKTVADCFKYRNKVGLDVALEALRDFRRLRKGSMDDLWRCAQVCRVANVMRPYLEATA